MKKNLLSELICLFIFLLLISSCSTRAVIKDQVEADRQAIAREESYRWKSMPTLKKSAETNQKRYSDFDILIQQSIDANLLKKGYQRIKNENAGLILDYRVLAATEMIASPDNQSNNFGPQWRFGDGNAPAYQGVTTPAEKTSFYTRGRLEIAVFNNDGKILWHRSAEQLLKEDMSVPERQQLLKKTIEKLLKDFPEKANTGNQPSQHSRWCFLPWFCH